MNNQFIHFIQVKKNKSEFSSPFFNIKTVLEIEDDEKTENHTYYHHNKIPSKVIIIYIE